MTKKIGFFVGSLRKDSYNRKVAEAFANMLPEGYEGVFIKIDDLPFITKILKLQRMLLLNGVVSVMRSRN